MDTQTTKELEDSAARWKIMIIICVVGWIFAFGNSFRKDHPEYFLMNFLMTAFFTVYWFVCLLVWCAEFRSQWRDLRYGGWGKCIGFCLTFLFSLCVLGLSCYWSLGTWAIRLAMSDDLR